MPSHLSHLVAGRQAPGVSNATLVYMQRLAAQNRLSELILSSGMMSGGERLVSDCCSRVEDTGFQSTRRKLVMRYHSIIGRGMFRMCYFIIKINRTRPFGLKMLTGAPVEMDVAIVT